MKILIDDMRSRVDKATLDVICRNAEAAKEVLLALHDHLDVVYYDYNLSGLGWNGYDLLKWALFNECAGKRVVLVSDHSIGRKNMEKLLRISGYTFHEGEWKWGVDWEAARRAAEATKHLRPQEYPESEKPKEV